MRSESDVPPQAIFDVLFTLMVADRRVDNKYTRMSHISISMANFMLSLCSISPCNQIVISQILPNIVMSLPRTKYT